MVAPELRLFVAKEAFKFSCAHMSVFPDGRKERLHGHNYFVQIELTLRDAQFENLVDFGPLKQAVASLCAEFKERLILAADNPHYDQVRCADGELEFRLCGERYVVPERDALLLPIDNVVVERLAEHVAARLQATLAPSFPFGAVTSMEVAVSESPGQGAAVRLTFG